MCLALVSGQSLHRFLRGKKTLNNFTTLHLFWRKQHRGVVRNQLHLQWKSSAFVRVTGQYSPTWANYHICCFESCMDTSAKSEHYIVNSNIVKVLVKSIHITKTSNYVANMVFISRNDEKFLRITIFRERSLFQCFSSACLFLNIT